MKHWIINSTRQIEHKSTRETSEFGLNGELYDVVTQGKNAGFTVLIRNLPLAGKLIRQGITTYPSDTVVEPGEELVMRRPIEDYGLYKDLLQIPDDIEYQLVIANRS
jgi:hypothetical protein